MIDNPKAQALKRIVVHIERRGQNAEVISQIRPREQSGVIRQCGIVGINLDFLRNEPVGGSEHQSQVGTVDIHLLQHVVDIRAVDPEEHRPSFPVVRRGNRRKDIHQNIRIRLPGEYDFVGVKGRGAFRHDGGSAGLPDHCEGLVVIRYIGGDAENSLVVEPWIVTFHILQDDAAVTQQIVAHDGRGVSRHIESIFTQSAENFRDEILARALHKEAVVTFRAVDAQGFDIDEVDIETGAEDTVLGNDEIIAEFRTDDDQRIETVAAVDVDGSVHRVLDEVGAGAAGDIRPLALRLLRPGQGKRPDLKDIVAFSAVELQYRFIVENGKIIVAESAINRHRRADAVGQETAGRFNSGKLIVKRGNGDIGVRRSPL